MDILKNIYIKTITFSILVFIGVYFLFQTFFHQANEEFFYLLKNTFINDKSVSRDLVLVEIDEKTLNNF